MISPKKEWSRPLFPPLSAKNLKVFHPPSSHFRNHRLLHANLSIKIRFLQSVICNLPCTSPKLPYLQHYHAFTAPSQHFIIPSKSTAKCTAKCSVQYLAAPRTADSSVDSPDCRLQTTRPEYTHPSPKLPSCQKVQRRFRTALSCTLQTAPTQSTTRR